jgi:hypothetical protein
MPNQAFKSTLGYNPGRANKPNVLNSSVRQGILAVWHRTGGVEGMVKWVEESSDNRGQFYGYLTRLLPHELAESGLAGSITVHIHAKPKPITEITQAEPPTDTPLHIDETS